MTLINLTQEYVDNSRYPFLKRMIVNLNTELDLYRADSLLDMQEGFMRNPPTRIEDFSEMKSAYVFLENVWIRETELLFVDDIRGIRWNFPEGLPNFDIKDSETKRVVGWMAGNYENYLEIKKKFGFNLENFVRIRGMILIYRHCPDYSGIGSVSLYKFLSNNVNFGKKKKSFLDFVLNVDSPAISEHSYQY